MQLAYRIPRIRKALASSTLWGGVVKVISKIGTMGSFSRAVCHPYPFKAVVRLGVQRIGVPSF